MWDFIACEKSLLAILCKHAWNVMCGKYALIEVRGLSYHIRIDPDHTQLSKYGNINDQIQIPTVKFKAYLEMYRI